MGERSNAAPPAVGSTDAEQPCACVYRGRHGGGELCCGSSPLVLAVADPGGGS